MIKIGIIGCGYWGPNHVRIFSQLTQSEVVMCADSSVERLQWLKGLYSQVQTTEYYQDILSNPEIEAVVIATPTETHYQISKEALEANKHVLCEKPLSLRSQECLDLEKLAKKNEKILMVGHIFIFHQGILKLKEYISQGVIGRVLYAHSQRTNLGPFRYDVNALWDLAPHDVSIFNYLLDAAPVRASACGQEYLGTSHEDLAFATLEYPDNVLVNIHVSWLDPRKVRRLTIVGDQKMMTWDDLDNLGPIKLYDKHVQRTKTFYQTYGEFQLLSKEGSITIPNVKNTEPLKTQAIYFLDCINNGRQPVLTDAQKALRVVKALSAIQKSIQQKGQSVDV